MSFDSVISVIASSFIKDGDSILTGLFALVVAAFASNLLQGFTATYAVPVLIVIALGQYFVLPLSFIYSNTLPIEIRLPLIFLLNLLLVLGVVDFIRGKT